jgi:hypothetical protein
MITNKVYRLLKESQLPNGIKFDAGQEIEIVMDVVYIGGFPLPQDVQGTVYNWITSNPTLFKDDTRVF